MEMKLSLGLIKKDALGFFEFMASRASFEGWSEIFVFILLKI
jgi:hypothetical protein